MGEILLQAILSLKLLIVNAKFALTETEGDLNVTLKKPVSVSLNANT
jgi:hypothetical protein